MSLVAGVLLLNAVLMVAGYAVLAAPAANPLRHSHSAPCLRGARQDRDPSLRTRFPTLQ
jgi:hypothetical protein